LKRFRGQLTLAALKPCLLCLSARPLMWNEWSFRLLHQKDPSLESLTARDVWEAAQTGDVVTQGVLETTGKRLGEAIELLVDFVNPSLIVAGGLGVYNALIGPARMVTRPESLPGAAEVCRIVRQRSEEESPTLLRYALHWTREKDLTCRRFKEMLPDDLGRNIMRLLRDNGGVTFFLLFSSATRNATCN